MNESLPLRWIRATWLAWILSIPFIVLFALLGEALGVGGAQVFVGAGIGIAMGLLQGRIARGTVSAFAPWFWSCAVGFTLPFLARDLAAYAGLDVPYSLATYVMGAGAVVAVWQAFLLRARFRAWGLWVVASGTGWALGAASIAAAESLSRTGSLRGVVGALAFLGVASLGGLVLGVVSGGALAWMARSET